MAKTRGKAGRWGIYKTMPWGDKRLLGRVRAHSEEGARNEAEAHKRFNGWDTIEPLDQPRE